MRYGAVVAAVLSVMLASGCGGNGGEGNGSGGDKGKTAEPGGPASVACTPAQAEAWRQFVQEMARKKWPPMALYTRKPNPLKSLDEVTSKDQFAICKMYSDYSGVMLRMLGYKPDDLVGLQVRGGHPDTLEEQGMRLYLAFEEWEEKLGGLGWVRVKLAPR